MENKDLKEFILELRSILHEIDSEAKSSCSYPSVWGGKGFQRIEELGKKIMEKNESSPL